MNTQTYIIDKQTAKDICSVRRAQHYIDAIELADEFGGKFRPPDSPNIAYLENGTMLPPFRCDIVSKWVQLADRQQHYGMYPETDDVHFSVSENDEIMLRCGQSSVRLYKIDQGSEPPIHPLPIVFDNERIKLNFDHKTIIDKAKSLKSKAKAAKVEAKQKTQEEANSLSR